jgi:hypothetical protein
MDSMGTTGIDKAITLGYWVSFLGFLIATIIIIVAVRKFGKSTLGSIFSYLIIGTGTLLAVTIFQKLGGDFFGISSASTDIWWHFMFYMAFIFYFYGLKLLVGLGDAEAAPNQGVKIGEEKKWGLLAILVLFIIFTIPKVADKYISAYTGSVFGTMGLHHFIAFVLAGVVGYYLLSAKKRLGQIGRAIATPMIIATWALALQHLWELLNESWKVVKVTSAVGEGVEKIFLTIAAISIGYAAWRLKNFAQPK